MLVIFHMLNIVMFRLIIFTAILFYAVNCYAIDLEEAIYKAVKNSSRVQSQLYEYKGYGKQLKSVGIAGFLPDVNLQYHVRHSIYGSGVDGIQKELTLDQILIDCGRSFAIFNRSSNLLKAEKAKFNQSKQEVALSAVKEYVNVLQKREMLKLREHKERVALEHLSAMEKRFSLGEVTNAKILLAKAKLLSALSKRIDAEGKLKLAKMTYQHLIGEEANDLAEIDNSFVIPELDECLQLAKANNLTLKAMFFKKKAAQMEVAAGVSKLFPSLTLKMKKGFDRLDSPFAALFSLNVPLFNRGQSITEVSKARVDAKKSAYNYYETVKNVEQMVMSARNNVLTAEAVVKAGQEAEKAISLALDGIKQEVDLSLKTTADLLDAENDLFKACSDLVEAKSNYVINVYSLLFTINSVKL